MFNGGIALAVTVVTSLVFLALGIIYVGRRRLSVEDYIVSRNSAGSMLATATLVASVIGAWILFSPAETGTWAGLVAIVGYGIGQAAPLVAFIILGPRMRRLMPEGHSLTEYVWHRYGLLLYVFVVLVIVFYMFVFLSAELTGISLAVQELAEEPLGLSAIGISPLGLTAIIVGVFTVAYTAYGGMRASLFTDRIQFYLILPLLLIVFIGALVALGGFGDAFETVQADRPELLSFSHGPGIEFGVTLIIAILAANMFHQGFWQRVYTCRDDKTLRMGFAIAGAVVIPIIVIAGLFGIMAVGQGVATQPSVAMFSLVVDAVPTWVGLVVLVLALVLVMSSMDTLLNGIASSITSDLARARPLGSAVGLLRSSRIITLILIIPAIFIASQGYSVLYLFLIADLVTAAALFPVFFGMYSSRITGWGALIASVVGLAVGVLYFPTPTAPYIFGWNDWVPLTGRLVYSFGFALGASTLLSVVFAYVPGLSKSEEQYDFATLSSRVRLIEG